MQAEVDRDVTFLLWLLMDDSTGGMGPVMSVCMKREPPMRWV